MRAAILRPGRPPEETVFPGDEDADTVHYGVYVDGTLIGVASVYREAAPGEDDTTTWRLRGMAILPQRQRQGYGKALVEACISYVAARGGTRLWCNARTPAVGFYRTVGFETHGPEFEIPGIGPHFLMWRPIE